MESTKSKTDFDYELRNNCLNLVLSMRVRDTAESLVADADILYKFLKSGTTPENKQDE